MFDFFKKKTETLPVAQQADIEREMGLTEYVSIDSIKAHLVDMLEENRRLKKENEELRESSRREAEEQRKEYELQLVVADEWKKRAGETEQEAKELRRAVDKQDAEIEKMQKERVRLIADAETARDLARKAEEKAQKQWNCRYWLEERLKNYGNWEKMTKTQLVEILKEAMKNEQVAGQENDGL